MRVTEALQLTQLIRVEPARQLGPLHQPGEPVQPVDGLGIPCRDRVQEVENDVTADEVLRAEPVWDGDIRL
jgi:hypothetical protein